MRKALVMIYPLFSMQEISCLTEVLSYNQKEMIVCAKDRNPVLTEDGFHVLADLTYQQVKVDDYDCLILPGICAFTNVLKEEVHIEFLRQFISQPNIIIGSISSSVALLAKAGLLQDKKFTGGLYPESLHDLPFIQEENFVKQAICIDHNIVTAYGPAY